MQYLTGEVKADFLDEATDLIATDRGTVRWEDPVAAPLKEWGQKKVAQLLRTWTDKRREVKVILHVPVGRASFDKQKLVENIATLLDVVKRMKPSSAKGVYLKTGTLSSTMGPPVPLDPGAMQR